MAELKTWSYSAATTYEQCPKKYFHLYVAKDVKSDNDSPSLKFGNEVLFEGHRITPQDFVDIFNGLGDAGRSAVARVIEVTDEQLEEGEF